MPRVEVALDGRGYRVTIGKELIEKAGQLLETFLSLHRLIVVSDATVWGLHGPRLGAALGHLQIIPVLVPEGEAGKSWQSLIGLSERLLELGLERGEPLAAFGGGAVGDVAGFAAAILKRGCPWLQIPTTLLAQVDASVGGKTAINAGAGKNMVGAFHQPTAVLADIGLLETLPERQLRAGYAEVAKYGLIGDPAFFSWCEGNGAALIAGDEAARLHAIETSVRAKAETVAADERETSGRRALLNLGHTFGHALEAEAGYSDRLLHGEAVALGIALAFRFSAERGLCPAADAERVAAHLQEVGLPTSIRDCAVKTDAERMLARMAGDKKAAGGRLTLILVRGIGRAFVEQGVEPRVLGSFLERECN